MTEYQTHSAIVAQLDRTASELQDTCHKQSQRIAVLERAVRRALEALLVATPVKAKDPRMQADAIVALLEAQEAAPPPAAVEQEPVLVVEREPSYMDRGHFYKGDKPHIDPTKVWKLPIGTKLYTAPQPTRQAARQPLDEGKLKAMWVQNAPHIGAPLEFARAIEKAHGIGGEA